MHINITKQLVEGNVSEEFVDNNNKVESPDGKLKYIRSKIFSMPAASSSPLNLRLSSLAKFHCEMDGKTENVTIREGAFTLLI